MSSEAYNNSIIKKIYSEMDELGELGKKKKMKKKKKKKKKKLKLKDKLEIVSKIDDLRYEITNYENEIIKLLKLL